MKKHLPNLITLCNLFSGCVATVFALGGDYRAALAMICVGNVFDFFDGLTARLLGVSSAIGKELDSLADVVTSGVAPSAMLYMLLQSCGASPVQALGAFIIAAFSGLRLAKFNLDTRQSTSFIGLPTPANALFWGALVYGAGERLAAWPGALPSLGAGIILSSWLLVSEVPMFALKFKTWAPAPNALRYGYLAAAAVLVGTLGAPGLSAAVALYVVLSLLTQKRNA